MGTSRQDGRKLYESHLDLIDRVVGFVCRRNGLRGDEGEDFRSEVHLRLMDSEFSILRAFDGRSSLKTYLTVVIQRLMLDFRTERWGRWRPSEAARRLGDDAVLLETLIVRDGHDFSDAVSIMTTTHGVTRDRDELYEMTLSFPLRWGRSSSTTVPTSESLHSPERSPEQQAIDRETIECERELSEALTETLQSVEPEERLLLRLVHLEGRKISTIARMMQQDQQSLYRTMYRLQKQFRTTLERRGLGWDRTVALLERAPGARLLDLESIFGRCPSPEDEMSTQPEQPGSGAR